MLSWLQTKSVDILNTKGRRNPPIWMIFFGNFPNSHNGAILLGPNSHSKYIVSICSKNNSQRAHLEHHKSAYIYFLHIANLKLIMINAAADQSIIDILPLFSTSPTKLLSSAFLCDLSIRQCFWLSSKLCV